MLFLQIWKLVDLLLTEKSSILSSIKGGRYALRYYVDDDVPIVVVEIIVMIMKIIMTTMMIIMMTAMRPSPQPRSTLGSSLT